MKKIKPIITISCRLNSKRLPRKALELIENKPAIIHLIERLKASNLRIVLCTSSEKDDLLLVDIAKQTGIDIYCGSKENVMLRLIRAARNFNADHIVRVTADDLLVDIPIMREIIKQHFDNDDDYTFMNKIPKGMDCEVIRVAALERILAMSPGLESTEFISYYLKKPGLFKYSVYIPSEHYQRDYHLTLDYPEDLKLLKVIFSNMPKNFTNWELIDYLDRHQHLLEINKLPKVSCYITNHNCGEFIEQAIDSVLYQTLEDWELIIIDDGSQEIKSLFNMLKYSENQKIRLIRNEENQGLNRTANKALSLAKGEYIIRLDADDIFLPRAFEFMVKQLDSNQELGIIYPDYYEWGDCLEPHKGRENNHPAGAMIRKSCWNEVKYNENYRCQDGFDFFVKFRQRFGIGYLNQPCFIYRQHKDSLSKNRELIEQTNKQMRQELNGSN